MAHGSETYRDGVGVVRCATCLQLQPCGCLTTAPTHYCDADASGKYLVRALCGEILRRREHVEDPTCVDCRKALAYRAARDGVVPRATVESPQFGIDPMAEILGKIRAATALRARELTDQEWQKLADDTGFPIRRLDGRTMIPASRRQEQDHEDTPTPESDD